MLTYDEALARVLAETTPLPAETIPVADAYGRAVAEPIAAFENLPPFDNSAVDGFAIRLADSEAAKKNTLLLNVEQTILAGSVTTGKLPMSGYAVRVMTGSPVPDGTEAIVMQEDTDSLSEAAVVFLDGGSPKFIRRAGSDVRLGETVMNVGDVVNAGSVGLLSSLGVTRVACHVRPRVGILSTGDELVPAHTKTLPPAKIRDSNSHALEAAVVVAGGIAEARLHAPDDEAAIRKALLSLSGCDVVISSGGVSVGDADFVKGIVEEIGSLDFWRIAIKPGKPLAFGRVGNALFFGLPGNPVSSLVTFELFVRPVLRRLAGHRETSRPRVTATLAEPLSHEPGRREFVRARLEYRDGEALATTTGAQGSHRIASLVGANALLVAHEDHGDYAAGDRLPALLLL